MSDLISGVGILPMTTAHPDNGGLSVQPYVLPGDPTVQYYVGAVCIFTSGLAVVAADEPSAGTIIGIANNGGVVGHGTVAGSALDLLDNIEVIPALPSLTFEANLMTANGTSVSNYTLLATDMGAEYSISLDTTSHNWYLDQAEAATTAFGGRIIGFKDPVGTVNARVYFKFNISGTIFA